jgi:hypothetical protein
MDSIRWAQNAWSDPMPEGSNGTRLAIARHIRESSQELREIAKRADMLVLATILDMAALQAAQHERGDAPAADRHKH